MGTAPVSEPEPIGPSPIPRRTDPEALAGYLADESRRRGSAEAVYLPHNEGEVAAVVAAAAQRGIPVTVRGAGTGVVAGAVPAGGWVLATERLNRIGPVAYGEVNGQNQPMIDVEAGATLDEIARAAAEHGLFYPPNPTESTASIGGNINTDAAGSRAFRYGATRDYVEELRLVLADGKPLHIRRGETFFDAAGRLALAGGGNGSGRELVLPSCVMPAVKNSAGYFVRPGMDLIDLFIGAEGTLGVVTGARLRLLPTPGPVLSGLVFFATPDEALTFVEAARYATLRTRQQDGPGLNLRAIEFIHRSALELVREPYAGRLPEGAATAILIEQELPPATAAGGDFENCPAVRELFALLGDQLEDERASWISFPGDERHMQRIIAFRHAIPEQVNRRLTYEKMGTDLIAPPARLREFVTGCTAIPLKHDVPHATWGHISKCQLHVNLLPTTAIERERALAAYADLARMAVALGGSVAAEHGIGKTKHPYLEIQYGRDCLAGMRQLKETLDPHAILGRGNIFP